ncbi:unnamed protein product [Triticum turgidum subsp. durum]|uniref:Uncharacterized protein n=1 Tax=Triticum turgidum subsp. durum TaxID=4567 RepID=A0A9R0S524_TRITD|nr:unnamed protein product [Triticum turgidum subsp. durum]
MSQFHHTQHGGDGDFQMWQQQMMYKQLQEFQRQQNAQQIDHGARMQPSFGQFQAPARAAPADQLPVITNEMPNNEATAYAWPQNFASGDPRLPGNSQMVNTGSNTNWEQYGGAPAMGNFMNGSVFPNTQSQPMRPMGLATQQMNQSFYQIPATSRGGSVNQYPQFLGIPADLQNAMTRASTHQPEKVSRPFSSLMDEPSPQEKGASSSMQNFRGKGGFLSNSLLQSQGDNNKAGSPVPVNHLRHGFQLQDFHGRSNQLQAGLQEKSTMQVAPASGGASLDPTEEKFLFGDDEDSNWGALLKGDNDHGNSLDNDNFGGTLPSLQSGSWSALMQETLQSSTSKDNPKEEWSGLSLQKTQTVANNSTLPARDQSKLAALSGGLQNARPSSASSYGDGTMNNPDFTSFQHATRSPYEQRDKTPHESPRATVTNHQSTAEANNGYIQQSLKQKQSDEYGRQEQVHLSNGNWAQQKSETPRNSSHSTGAPSSTHGFWMSQQNTVDNNINQESSNSQNDWKSNSPLGQDISSTQNVFNSDGNFWKSSGGNANSVHRLQQMKPDISTSQMQKDSSDGKGVSMMGSSMSTINPNQHQMVMGRTGEHGGVNHNIGRRGSETSESLRRSAEPRPNDCNQEYQNAIHMERPGNILNPGQHVNSDHAARRHPFFAAKESQNLGSGQQAGGSYMLQNHAMDNTGGNIRHSPGNPVSNNQFPPQSLQGQNNLKPRFITNSQVAANMASVNEKKMLVGDEHFKSRHGVTNSSSASPFGVSDAGQSQNRAVQTSQHMLQLLHKVDNSTDSNALTDMANSPLDNVANTQQQLNQSSLQGFGLRLAPPSQRHPASDQLWSSHTNADGKQPEHSARGEHQAQLPSTATNYSSPAHPSSQPTPFHSSEMGGTGQPAAHFPQLSSGQQYPVPDARSGSVPMPQQDSTATVFKNVWTNISAQRLAGGTQSNKITPNILQSMMFSNNPNLWGSQKADDQGQKASTPPDVATSSANSHNQETKQALDSDAGQGESPAANFQVMNTSHNTGTNMSGIGLHGNPTPSNLQQTNFALLHQMQAMGHVDVDPGNKTGKMLKPNEISSDASQVDWKSAQRFAHGATNSLRSSIDNIGSTSVQGSFPSDMKMLSFAPRNNEERSTSIPSQIPSREVLSHGMVMRNDHQSQVQSLGTNASSNLIERSERPGINPQMAPSWFEHYGNQRNGQNHSVFNAQKTPTPPYNVPKASWCMENNSLEDRADAGQAARPLVPNMKTALVTRPKKRKFTERALVSWHKITAGTQKLRKTSTNEMDWAWAANRLIKKSEDDPESLEDAPVNYLPRKRLIMTTKLIQEVFPAIPARVLRAQAVSAYESATYNIAMFTLGDTCIISSDNSRALADNENNPSEQRTSAKQMEDKLSKVVEVFVGRIKKMENDYLRALILFDFDHMLEQEGFDARCASGVPGFGKDFNRKSSGKIPWPEPCSWCRGLVWLTNGFSQNFP